SFGLVGLQMKGILENRFPQHGRARPALRLSAGLVVALLAAALLNFQSEIHSYVSGLLIEAQKLPYVYGRLLKREAYLAPLVIAGILVACWITWSLVRRTPAMKPLVRGAFLVLLLSVMAAAYYVDSRIEVQL